MAIKRFAAAAGVCVLAASGSLAQTAPENAGAPVAAPPAVPKAWPTVLIRPDARAAAAKPQWSREEVEHARARCRVLLRGLDVVALPEEPMREGGQCGTAAPMKLISIGKGGQQVTFSPQPIVTCDLIAGLAKWLEEDVQGLARKHLGAAITRIETMSSYSCRTAYGRPGSRLSEHGRANALDIAAFVTDRNTTVSIEGDWGMTAREIATGQRAPDAPKPLQVVQKQRERPALGSVPVAPAPGPVAETSALPNLPGVSLYFSGPPVQPAFEFDQPSRLGGPKSRAAPVASIPPPPPARGIPGPRRAEFLRSVHKVACRTFGTVLGPEANHTHRHHFHVDMAERIQNAKVCE